MKTALEWALELRDRLAADDEWNEWDVLVVETLLIDVQMDALGIDPNAPRDPVN